MHSAARAARMAVLGAAFLSPLASHAALASGLGLRMALGLAALQAAAVGVVLWDALGPGQARFLAPLASLAMMAALALGAMRSAQLGLLASAGASHALLYCALLGLFGHTLLPGRVPLVTQLALRLNPAFHDGMRGYTRAVTVAWCLFFATQLTASAMLLLLAPKQGWGFYVSTLHLPLVVVMAGCEYAVRCRRFRGQPMTGFTASLRGVTGKHRNSGGI